MANFDTHLQSEHNLEKFVYFLAYLRDREENDSVGLTDIESYALKCYRKKENYWVPIGRSLTLEQLRNE